MRRKRLVGFVTEGKTGRQLAQAEGTHANKETLQHPLPCLPWIKCGGLHSMGML